LPPAAVLHSIPAAEHLQPSVVPPVVLVGLALAVTVLGSLSVADLALELLADLLPFPLPVLLVFVLPGPQPASTSMTNASTATSLIFMGCLLFEPG
jgi:prepilin signal peptidase PulO-like enzyme (type II secretory pathway)